MYFLRKQEQPFEWRSRSFQRMLIELVEALEEKALLKLNELKALGLNALQPILGTAECTLAQIKHLGQRGCFRSF